MHVWTWYILYSIFFFQLLINQDARRLAPQKVAHELGIFCLAPSIQFHDCPRTLPDHVYISVHHRMSATPLEFHTMFAFLSHFDEIHVAIGLNTKKIAKFGLAWLPHYIFGAIDLRSMKTSDEKYFALVDPMQNAMQFNRKCAILVFPDIAGSTHWGDRTMIARDGLYAASASLGIPILDILHFEPTVVSPGLSHVYFKYDTPELLNPKQNLFTNETYKAWRQQSNHAIQQWKQGWQSYVVSTVDEFETHHEGCFLADEFATCDRSQEPEILNNLSRNLTANIHLH